jgi:MATE family, multidrug efflux pump
MMEHPPRNDTDLLTLPVRRLLARMAVPVGIGFFFNTMFNVVDTFFAGLISTQALAVLSLAFPLIFMILAIGAGISTGATALIGHALGAGRMDKARRLSVQTISFGMLHGILISLFGRLAAPYLFRFLGAEGEYLRLALSYMYVIFDGALFFIINQVLNASLNASGDTRPFRNFLVAGFFVNVLLDPLFIFGGFGLPALGLPGVALATVSVQVLGNFYLLRRLRRTGLLDGFRPRLLLPHWRCYRDLALQGFPASLNMLTVAFGVVVITKFLSGFGREAVAAYGIAARLEQLALLPVMGLNIATLTIVARNSGAGLYSRVRKTIRTALVAGVSLTAPVALVAFVFAPRLMALFTSDPAVIAVGAGYLHVAAFLFSAYVIIYICVFSLQGLKQPFFAILIGLYRQILAPLPVFYLLARQWGLGVTGIWWGIFLVNWSATVITVAYVRAVLRQLPRDGSSGVGDAAAGGAEVAR